MPIMAPVGCVESGDDGRFHLVRAAELEALQEGMPEEPPADTPLGARTIRLIGTLEEFGVPGRTGHKVWAKGLLNPEAPGGTDLLNLASITTFSDPLRVVNNACGLGGRGKAMATMVGLPSLGRCS